MTARQATPAIFVLKVFLGSYRNSMSIVAQSGIFALEFAEGTVIYLAMRRLRRECLFIG
jgi:hypothetical protein